MLLRWNRLMLLGVLFVFCTLVLFISKQRVNNSLLLEAEQVLSNGFRIGILGVAVAALAVVGMRVDWTPER